MLVTHTGQTWTFQATTLPCIGIITKIFFHLQVQLSKSIRTYYQDSFPFQMPLANRCQKHNAQAFHHLICEQHFFLRTLCLADSGSKDDKNKKKLKKLLCKSAANLTEVFLRLV